MSISGRENSIFEGPEACELGIQPLRTHRKSWIAGAGRMGAPRVRRRKRPGGEGSYLRPGGEKWLSQPPCDPLGLPLVLPLRLSINGPTLPVS